MGLPFSAAPGVVGPARSSSFPGAGLGAAPAAPALGPVGAGGEAQMAQCRGGRRLPQAGGGGGVSSVPLPCLPTLDSGTPAGTRSFSLFEKQRLLARCP